MEKIKISIEDLQSLLNQQKRLVIEKLLSQTYSYNTESSEGNTKSMQNINKANFEIVGMQANFPDDFNVLEKYSK